MIDDKDIRNDIISLGIDGIKSYEFDPDGGDDPILTWIVFDPNQIKIISRMNHLKTYGRMFESSKNIDDYIKENDIKCEGVYLDGSIQIFVDREHGNPLTMKRVLIFLGFIF